LCTVFQDLHENLHDLEMQHFLFEKLKFIYLSISNWYSRAAPESEQGRLASFADTFATVAYLDENYVEW